MAFLKVNYNLNGDKIDYKSVTLILKNGKEFNFDNGFFPKDWYLATKEYIKHFDEEVIFSYSSTIDKFISDGAPYEPVWLNFDQNGDKPTLSYEHTDGCLRFYVEKDSKPTWLQLKKICNDK